MHFMFKFNTLRFNYSLQYEFIIRVLGIVIKSWKLLCNKHLNNYW